MDTSSPSSSSATNPATSNRPRWHVIVFFIFILCSRELSFSFHSRRLHMYDFVEKHIHKLLLYQTWQLLVCTIPGVGKQALLYHVWQFKGGYLISTIVYSNDANSQVTKQLHVLFYFTIRRYIVYNKSTSSTSISSSPTSCSSPPPCPSPCSSVSSVIISFPSELALNLFTLGFLNLVSAGLVAEWRQEKAQHP